MSLGNVRLRKIRLFEQKNVRIKITCVGSKSNRKGKKIWRF